MSAKHTDCKWTEEEIRLLVDFAATKTLAELGVLIPAHTKIGIRTKIKRLKLKDAKKWTDEELSLLDENCNTKIADLMKLFPNRSRRAIQKTRARYGYAKYRNSAKWLPEEKQIILDRGSELFSTELAVLLPQHSVSAIHGMCFKLGVKKSKKCRVRLAQLAQSLQSPEVLLKLDQSFGLLDLDDTTRQILLGSIFGDGSCPKRGKNRNIFWEAHGWKQEDYVLWKKDKLSVFLPSYMDSINPCLYTASHPIFKFFREKLYVDKKEKHRLPNDIVAHLGLLGLLVWYLDDGYLGRPKSGKKSNGRLRRIYPHIVAKGYELNDLTEASLIINKNLGMTSYVRTTKHRGGTNKILCFNQDKHWLFPVWQQMAKKLGLPGCMYYKLNLHAKLEM